MNVVETELERILMARFGSFTRKATNTWISPAKSRTYYEDLRRVFCKDESPDGLYPACIIPQSLLQEIVVITPINQFKTLLEGWKKSNPKCVEAAKRLVKERSKEYIDKESRRQPL